LKIFRNLSPQIPLKEMKSIRRSCLEWQVPVLAVGVAAAQWVFVET
jgi:hypothetical protein